MLGLSPLITQTWQQDEIREYIQHQEGSRVLPLTEKVDAIVNKTVRCRISNDVIFAETSNIP